MLSISTSLPQFSLRATFKLLLSSVRRHLDLWPHLSKARPSNLPLRIPGTPNTYHPSESERGVIRISSSSEPSSPIRLHLHARRLLRPPPPPWARNPMHMRIHRSIIPLLAPNHDHHLRGSFVQCSAPRENPLPAPHRADLLHRKGSR
jgi:hypothetical protein